MRKLDGKGKEKKKHERKFDTKCIDTIQYGDGKDKVVKVWNNESKRTET